MGKRAVPLFRDDPTPLELQNAHAFSGGPRTRAGVMRKCATALRHGCVTLPAIAYHAKVDQADAMLGLGFLYHRGLVAVEGDRFRGISPLTARLTRQQRTAYAAATMLRERA